MKVEILWISFIVNQIPAGIYSTIPKEIPHNKGGWLASEFSVRRACKFRRLAGGKSRRYFPNS